MAHRHTCPQPTKEEVCTPDTTNPPGCMEALMSQDDQARSRGFLRPHQDCQKEMHLCSAEEYLIHGMFYNSV